MPESNTLPQDVCAYEACGCEVDEEGGVNRDGRLYCSDECADGEGCDHDGCGCGT